MSLNRSLCIYETENLRTVESLLQSNSSTIHIISFLYQKFDSEVLDWNLSRFPSPCLLKSGLGEYKCSLCYRYPCPCQCRILACFYSFSLHLSSKPLQLGWFLFFLKYIGLECLSLPALMTRHDYFVKEKATKCRKPSKYTKLLPDTSCPSSRVWKLRRGVHLTP